MASLAQDLLEQKTGLTYPDGYRHDDHVAAFAREVQETVLYSLTREATAMAAEVGLSKPSSILKALRFARPPFPKTWIEFDRRHLRDAMDALGSPLVKLAGRDVPQARIGFLVEERSPGTLSVSTATEQIAPDGRKLIDVLTCEFDIILGDLEATATSAVEKGVHPGSSGRVRDYQRSLAADPKEAAAADEIVQRCASRRRSPQAARLIRSLEGALGRFQVQDIEQRTTDESIAMAIQILIPSLILLACKNAIEVKDRTVEQKLNAIRAKKGKPPILPIREAFSRFTTQKASFGASGAAKGASTRRAALIPAHFKTRKNGVFWWSSHTRRGKGSPRTTRTIRP